MAGEAKKKRDYVAEVRARLARIADKDTRMVVSMNRLAEFSAAEFDAFLVMPDSAFPMHGFSDKAAMRIARYALMPKKDWPAGLQAAHERVGYVTRRDEPNKPTGQTGLIGIPMVVIGQMPAAPTGPMIVMRRNPRGELEAVQDPPPVDAEEVGDGPQR